MIKHIIFDMNRTLVTRDMTLREGVVERAYQADLNEVWDVHPGPVGDVLGEFCEREGISVEAFEKQFWAYVHSSKPAPGIIDLLDELSSEYGLHILSDSHGEIGPLIASMPELYDKFDSMTFSFEVGAVKPDQRMFRAALDKTGADPEQCIMVGDNRVRDIEGAKRAGMQAVYFDAESESVEQLRKRLNAILA